METNNTKELNTNGDFALTTTDNPYSPFTQFDQWLAFDEGKGYHSCELLARVANFSENLSEEENETEILRAMKSIVKLNVSGKHKIVYRQSSSEKNEVRQTGFDTPGGV